MTGFAAALARADAAVSAVMDETVFTAVAMSGMKAGQVRRDVNAPRTADSGRPSFTFAGTIDAEPSFSSFDQSNRVSPATLDSRHVASICITALVAGWAWVPRKDDEVRTGEAIYTVVAVDRDETSRAAFWVNRKG